MVVYAPRSAAVCRLYNKNHCSLGTAANLRAENKPAWRPVRRRLVQLSLRVYQQGVGRWVVDRFANAVHN